jgi:hypothetical protein
MPILKNRAREADVDRATKWRERRCRAVRAVLTATLACLVLSPTVPAEASYGFDNGEVVNQARSFPIGSYGDECKIFAANVVNAVLARHGIPARVGGFESPGGAYWGAYANAGGTRIDAPNRVAPGDLVQINNPRDRYSNTYYNGMHTAIVVGMTSSTGTFLVRDSNWNFTKTVKEHTWNPTAYATGYGLEANYWRFGSAGSSGVGATGSFSDGTFVSVNENGQVYRIVGGAPLYVSTWSAFGGSQPTVPVSLAQLNAMLQVPADGTFVVAAQRGEVYRIAGGAPLYVSTWSAFGGQQPTVSVDAADLDNAGAGGIWNHLRYTPADGTFLVGAQTGRVYRTSAGFAYYVSSWSQVGGQQPTLSVDQADMDNAGAGGVWNHLVGVRAL